MMQSTLASGDNFRDRIAALLSTRFDDVRTEIQLTAKKADICFDIRNGPRKTIAVAAECKKWNRALTRDDVKDIINDYTPALNTKQIQELWIICDQTPAAGARDYVCSYEYCQLMTALECEHSIIDFGPLLRFLITDFQKDPSQSILFRPPSMHPAMSKTICIHSSRVGLQVTILNRLLFGAAMEWERQAMPVS
jgi:hypothetical protein